MGAYLLFKTKSKDDASLAKEVLEEMEEHTPLMKINNGVYILDKADIEFTKQELGIKEDHHLVKNKIGTGSYKVSGMCEVEELLGKSGDEILEMLTVIFEKLNEKVEMRYFQGSCAFSGHYFTGEQISRITQNGKLISGRNK